MFRPASRVLLRAPATARGPASRRLISTAPAEASKSRSWKNTAVRLGLAAGAIYYYNTASVFAEPPSFSLREQITSSEPATSLTLDSIKPKIREQKESESKSKSTPSDNAQQQQQQQQPASEAALKSPEELEEEAGQEAAFNPETGEINWDCPCLGGMAHGPCGEEFKAAFSCFVYSTDEPKGIDCIEKFKGMQDCFRQYPEVYGAEIDDDEEAPAAAAPVSDGGGVVAPQSTASAAEIDASSHPDEKRARAKETVTETKAAAAGQAELSESDELLPKAWHDTEAKNDEQKEK
ncbi:coiled-coil-helix-coiled-coil-helix domain-containing protein [Aspergillus affinis]|uniref:coiled-coil-helix-coiled-coil-helix domain-containing protein n=1 Tax=Aspergillus affinis TaxID=1070780 RepID=UPI0022FF25C1|nr:uncharacterized protein KD926_008879 [Aspergillus affinis]KAI9045452.1 hypothetical protein KD926_008879 [Aspergillus affinis]